MPAGRHTILCTGLTPAWQELYECPRLVVGAVNRLPLPLGSAAGKGVNVARVLATLGSPVTLTGLSGGHTGAAIGRELRACGVRCHLTRVPQPTRTCRTLKDLATGEVTELVEESACPPANCWGALYRTHAELLPSARLLIIAGALMPGAPRNVYARLVRLARQQHVPVIIDSQREPLRLALTQRPFLAKLNVQELADTLGKQLRSDRAILAAARQLIAAGAAAVMVTHGAQGAWLIGPQEAWQYTPPRVRAVNPIGSGDAVTAGIAHALSHGAALPDAVRLGIACGAANALTRTAGTVRLPDVRRLDKRVAFRLV